MRVNKVSNEMGILRYVRVELQDGPELDAIIIELNTVVRTSEREHPYLTILRDRIVNAIR